MTEPSSTALTDEPDSAALDAMLVPAGGPTWQDQDGILRDLWLQNLPPPVIAEKLGRSVAAIMTRAVRLGLPRRAAPGRKPGRRLPTTDKPTETKARVTARVEEHAVAVPQPEPRICLMCLTKFASAGRHNRICNPCKGTADYLAASAIPNIHIEAGF